VCKALSGRSAPSPLCGALPRSVSLAAPEDSAGEKRPRSAN
jgi:hypothetical protein